MKRPILSPVTQPDIAMMMAMDKNRLIGSDGKMPWHIPGELAYFKRVTLGKPIIMGRKTFDSIGKPLPGRTNIVVTRNRQWQSEGVTVVHDLPSAVDQAGKVCLAQDTPATEMVVIGGAGLCRDAMSITQRLYLTVIDQEFTGDTWLESFHWQHWDVVSEDKQNPDYTGGMKITYWILEKKPGF